MANMTMQEVIRLDRDILAGMKADLKQFESGRIRVRSNSEDITEQHKADLKQRIAIFEALIEKLEHQYPSP